MVLDRVPIIWLPITRRLFQKLTGQSWEPGKTTVTNATLTFTTVPVGTYKLAVGLFQHTTDTNPSYKIGNQGRTSNGWYVLATVPVL